MSNSDNRSKKIERVPLTKKQQITVIIASVAAALIICAAIIIPIAISGKNSVTLDGEYVMSVSASSELTSSYTFDGDRAINTYYDGEEKITVEYTYKILKTTDGMKITLKSADTGKSQTFGFKEVTEDGKTVAIIMNTVWYEKK